MGGGLISYIVEDSKIVIVSAGMTRCLYMCVLEDSFDVGRNRYITGRGIDRIYLCRGKGGGVGLTCKDVLHFVVGREEGCCQFPCELSIEETGRFRERGSYGLSK